MPERYRNAAVKAVARGHAWFEDLVSGRATSVRAIARREGLSPRYVSRLLDLAFLPPKLVEAILEGAQPVDMTAETLTRGSGRWCGHMNRYMSHANGATTMIQLLGSISRLRIVKRLPLLPIRDPCLL